MTQLNHPPVLEATNECLGRTRREYRTVRVLVAGEAPVLLDDGKVSQTFVFDVQPDLDLASALLQDLRHSVVLIPLVDGEADAMQFLGRINEIHPGASKVVLGSPSDPSAMFHAVQQGVVDYLFPMVRSRDDLELILASAIERSVRDRAAAVLLTEVRRERAELALKFERESRGLREARSRLERMSVIDGPTGLYGQNYFRTTWRREKERSDRYERPLALMRLDLDRTKAGEAPSTEELRATGSFLLKSIRQVDFVAGFRTSGFAVILPECPMNHALALAERLRERFAASSNKPATRLLTMTIVVAGYPEGRKSRADTVSMADSALRTAMHSGRDQVVSLKSASCERSPSQVDGSGSIRVKTELDINGALREIGRVP